MFTSLPILAVAFQVLPLVEVLDALRARHDAARRNGACAPLGTRPMDDARAGRSEMNSLDGGRPE